MKKDFILFDTVTLTKNDVGFEKELFIKVDEEKKKNNLVDLACLSTKNIFKVYKITIEIINQSIWAEIMRIGFFNFSLYKTVASSSRIGSGTFAFILPPEEKEKLGVESKDEPIFELHPGEGVKGIIESLCDDTSKIERLSEPVEIRVSLEGKI